MSKPSYFPSREDRTQKSDLRKLPILSAADGKFGGQKIPYLFSNSGNGALCDLEPGYMESLQIQNVGFKSFVS